MRIRLQRVLLLGMALTAAFGALAATSSNAFADCNTDVANAFVKQREGKPYRMKTRQLSERGIVFMTVDYILPYKMKQTVRSATSAGESQLLLIGPRAWQSNGVSWVQLGDKATKALNQQFGASVLAPPKDKMKYECLGIVELDGRDVTAYQGKQGASDSVKTATVIVRTVYIDPKSGLPVRTTVARDNRPNLAFFKADYSYPDDIVIEPPKDFKPAPAEPDDEQTDAPGQTPAPDK